MEEEQKQIKVNLDPNMYAITNATIAFSEEDFVFTIFSGNQARRFFASPKHAKRISLLFKKYIDEYEEKFNEIKTELPEKPETGKKEQLGF